MTKFYHPLDFALSDIAKKWVIDRYADKFKTEFYHDADVTQVFSEQAQQEWRSSPLGLEVQEFLDQYGLDTRFFGITAFVHNNSEPYPGNPHVDSVVDQDMNFTRLKTRLNIMVLGNPEDPMEWWDWMDFDDDRYVSADYTTIDAIPFTYPKSIPGATKQDKFKFLGAPTLSVKNALAPSSFVKTDCVHNVSLSPGPRLIVTVCFDKTIDEILSLHTV
jgi:hypothetical protein